MFGVNWDTDTGYACWCSQENSCKLKEEVFMKYSCWDSFFDLPLEVRQADELQLGYWFQLSVLISWYRGPREPSGNGPVWAHGFRYRMHHSVKLHPQRIPGAASLLSTCLQTHFCFFLVYRSQGFSLFIVRKKKEIRLSRSSWLVFFSHIFCLLQ